MGSAAVLLSVSFNILYFSDVQCINVHALLSGQKCDGSREPSTGGARGLPRQHGRYAARK